MLDPFLLQEIIGWIRSTLETGLQSLPASVRATEVAGLAEITSFQESVRPICLLRLLGTIVPHVPPEPSFSRLSLDVEGRFHYDDDMLLTIYVSACKRFGMRCVFQPRDLLDGTDLPAVVANLCELRAISAAAATGQAVQFDYAAVASSRDRLNSVDSTTVRHRPPLRRAGSHAPPLTYAEHAALYAGSLSLEVTPGGRQALWAWLLAHDSESVTSLEAGRAAALAAARKVSEAWRALAGAAGGGLSLAAAGTLSAVAEGAAAPDGGDGAAATVTQSAVDALLLLHHALVSPGGGAQLARRRLVRSLVRAGVPPRYRGFLWARFTGLCDREPALVTLPTQPGSPSLQVESHACSACVREALSHHPAPSLHGSGSHDVPPSLVSAVAALRCPHTLVPAIVPEIAPPPSQPPLVLQPTASTDHASNDTSASMPQQHPVPPCCDDSDPAIAALVAPLCYYDRLLLVNHVALGRQLPARLRRVAAAILHHRGLQQQQRSVAESSAAAAPVEQAGAASAASAPATVPASAADGAAIRVSWRGRALGGAPIPTVKQIDADLRRTTPHLWPLEQSRVRVRAREAAPQPAQPGGSDGNVPSPSRYVLIDDVSVRYLYAPRGGCLCDCAEAAQRLASPAPAQPSGGRAAVACACCQCSARGRSHPRPVTATPGRHPPHGGSGSSSAVYECGEQDEGACAGVGLPLCPSAARYQFHVHVSPAVPSASSAGTGALSASSPGTPTAPQNQQQQQPQQHQSWEAASSGVSPLDYGHGPHSSSGWDAFPLSSPSRLAGAAGLPPLVVPLAQPGKGHATSPPASPVRSSTSSVGLAAASDATAAPLSDIPAGGGGWTISVSVAEPAIRRVLLAFASHCPPLDYCQGLNFIVAHALRWASESDAFALLTSLMHRLLPPHYYDHGLAGAARDQAVLAEMLLQAVPGTLEALARMAGNLPAAGNVPHGASRGKGGKSAGDGGPGGSPSPSSAPAHASPAPVDAGILLGSADSITGMTLKWFMCMFTIPFHACFTDRVWDAVAHEGVHALWFSPRQLQPQQQQQHLTGGIYWPSLPHALAQGPGAPFSPPGACAIAPPPPCGATGNKTLFRVALALLRMAAPAMGASKSFGDAVMVLDAISDTTSQARVFTALFDSWIWPLPQQQQHQQQYSQHQQLALAQRRGAAGPQGTLQLPAGAVMPPAALMPAPARQPPSSAGAGAVPAPVPPRKRGAARRGGALAAGGAPGTSPQQPQQQRNARSVRLGSSASSRLSLVDEGDVSDYGFGLTAASVKWLTGSALGALAGNSAGGSRRALGGRTGTQKDPAGGSSGGAKAGQLASTSSRFGRSAMNDCGLDEAQVAMYGRPDDSEEEEEDGEAWEAGDEEDSDGWLEADDEDDDEEEGEDEDSEAGDDAANAVPVDDAGAHNLSALSLASASSDRRASTRGGAAVAVGSSARVAGSPAAAGPVAPDRPTVAPDRGRAGTQHELPASCVAGLVWRERVVASRQFILSRRAYHAEVAERRAAADRAAKARGELSEDEEEARHHSANEPCAPPDCGEAVPRGDTEDIEKHEADKRERDVTRERARRAKERAKAAAAAGAPPAEPALPTAPVVAVAPLDDGPLMARARDESEDGDGKSPSAPPSPSKLAATVPERFTSPGAAGRAPVRHIFRGRNPHVAEASSSPASSNGGVGAEHPAAAHRLLSFFYRQARTGRHPPISLSLVEGFFP